MRVAHPHLGAVGRKIAGFRPIRMGQPAGIVGFSAYKPSWGPWGPSQYNHPVKTRV